MMLFVSLFVFCLFFSDILQIWVKHMRSQENRNHISWCLSWIDVFLSWDVYIYTCIYIYRYICFLNSMHPNKKISLVPSGAGLQQESWTFWMSELAASQASVVALLSWPSCLCRDSLQRQIFATCLRPKTRPCSWSLLYLCAISVLSFWYLYCLLKYKQRAISVLSFWYLYCLSKCKQRAISVLSMLSNEICRKIGCAISVLSMLSLLSLCYLCAISVLSLCYLYAFSALSLRYLVTTGQNFSSDIPPLSQQARDAQCFVCLFVVKVSMPICAWFTQSSWSGFLASLTLLTFRSPHRLVFGHGDRAPIPAALVFRCDR